MSASLVDMEAKLSILKAETLELDTQLERAQQEWDEMQLKQV